MNALKTISSKSKYLLAAVCAFLFGGISNFTYAQDVLGTVQGKMSEMVQTTINIARIGMIIGGAILLIMVIFNLFKGEREAAGKLGWWVVGLAIGIAILSILPGFANAS